MENTSQNALSARSTESTNNAFDTFFCIVNVLQLL